VDIDVITRLLTIIAIDLVLSGDNAVVIAMASRRLPAEQRRTAILFGGGGAVVLRIIFTILAALLLGVPLLQAIGGLLLIYIALKLVRPEGDTHGSVEAATTLGTAIRTIILADAVMSLDNMLAVGGAASGHLLLLIFGLALSIPILLFGSSAIAHLIDRFPWLNYVGAAILVHTAMEMFFKDDYVRDFLHVHRALELGIIAIVVAAVVVIGYITNRRAIQRHAQQLLEHGGRKLDAPEPGV
jgi:YjbE family integral membrane protein